MIMYTFLVSLENVDVELHYEKQLLRFCGGRYDAKLTQRDVLCVRVDEYSVRALFDMTMDEPGVALLSLTREDAGVPA